MDKLLDDKNIRNCAECIEGYIIMQAEAKKFVGLKGDGNSPNWFAVYTTKEEARMWLKGLLQQIAHEQSIGWRTPDNLVKETGLDFLIQKVEINIPTDEAVKRGWVIPIPRADSYAYNKEIAPHYNDNEKRKAYKN